MQYYTERHRHTCGVDLHGRNLYVAPQGTPAFWDAGSHPASQRRTSTVVAWWKSGRAATTLLGRRRPASDVENRPRSSRREGCPAAPLCGAYRVAGRPSLHNGVPGTPR